MTHQGILHHQRQLIRCLTIGWEKQGLQVQLFETHISWVLVAGNVAYKFKKAVHVDFLDFSTLDARHFYCREEVRLNRRLAPSLYLGVVAITGSVEHPLIDAPGTPLEYAVKMRAFPQQALWRYRLETKLISPKEIDALAGKIANFHREAAIAAESSAWGTPDMLETIANDNLALIAALVENTQKNMQKAEQVQEIKAWQVARQQTLRHLFEHRKARGFVKECHGDLHSGNILSINNQVEVFDCIEFNESLRWIDVMNDIAFICMDLQCQERGDLAARLLNRYLEITGDYEGVAVLRYYQVERALVRCKVALMRARQLRAEAQDASRDESQGALYLAWSAAGIRPAPTAIMIMHGYSGSGKSTFSQCLLELVGAIRLRSDVERKRMHGLAATSRAAAAPGAELYDSTATQLTYRRLRLLARQVVDAGLPVIVDAAFLRKEQRCLFEKLAQDLGVPFFIFMMQASEIAMKERIAARAQRDQDPSDAGLHVLARQMTEHDPLSDDEIRHAIVVDSNLCMDIQLIRKIADPAICTLRRS